MKWLTKLIDRLTGAEAEIAQLRQLLGSEKQAKMERGEMLCECQERLAEKCEQLVEVETAHDTTVAKLAEVSRLLGTERTGRALAEAKLTLAQHYLTDIPTPTPDDIKWEDDDAKTLATFLETSATGKKLAQHLANRLADYERAAVLYRSPADMPALLKRAHGFRDCRGEILRLSAAGPTPANHEQPDFPLPTDLENLRG